ncbi:MAG: LCP family protein [Peptococcaceae bacterium]|nr:LCP family protein [Peptococcaceae bacterium]
MATTGQTDRKKGKAVKWLLTVVGVIAALGVAGAYYYHTLTPQQHFVAGNIPVVSKPTVAAVTTAATAGVTTSASLPAASKDRVFNVLLLGSDEQTTNIASRTDSIMLVHVDIDTQTYNILSIPRDTRINLPGYGETKITHASYMGGLAGGPAAAMKSTLDAVSNLTGVAINYFAETDYRGLQGMVDAVGGVEVTIPYRIALTYPWYSADKGKVFNPGTYFLNGQMATEIVHERYSLQNGDFGRQQTQEIVLKAILKKAMNPANIANLPQLIAAAHSFLINTNMSTEDMLSLAIGLKGLKAGDIHYYQLTGHSLYAMDPIVQTNLYYFVPDMQQLNTIIAQHFAN